MATAAVTVATLGAGKYSLDAVLFPGHHLLAGWHGLLISLVLGLGGGIGQLLLFYRPPVKQAS
jgi:putative oxidoreductase